MTLIRNLPTELEERLKREAASKGQNEEDAALSILERTLLLVQRANNTAGEERARAFLEWAESHRRDIPPLSDEAISRASIYGDLGL